MVPNASTNMLSKRLYEETQVAHGQVESMEFMVKLRDKSLPQKCYLQYLVDLEMVYGTLEQQMEAHRQTEAIKNLYFLDLCRTKHLQKDIRSFNNIVPYPTLPAKDYCKHLNSLANNNPLLLVAHAYVRYLGDLSGGRILQKYVNDLYGEGHDSFYDFQELLGNNPPGITFVNFKKEWKRRLDELQLSPNQQQELIDETRKAFEFAGKLLAAEAH